MIRPAVLNHIRKNAEEKGIQIDFINCVADHVHCLIVLSNDQTLVNTLKLLKGESAHWINQEKLVAGKFGWQDEYFAVSVSESGRERVRNYIRDQAKHHERQTIGEEFGEFMRRHAFGK